MQHTLSGLYAITNEKLMPEEVFKLKAEAALSAGVTVLQYRDKSTDTEKRIKQATTLRNLCNKYNAILIINDDIELAKEVKADGIHIGKDDHSLKTARQYLGNNSIIGVSCYDQLHLAQAAVKNGADYIAFGSFFSSSVKPDAPRAGPDLIRLFKSSYATPVCCIGGITTHNHPPLLRAGADMLAVISDIFSHSSTLEIQQKCWAYTKTFKP